MFSSPKSVFVYFILSNIDRGAKNLGTKFEAFHALKSFRITDRQLAINF